MYAVIFEVYPTTEGTAEYLNIAANLKEFLSSQPGFISIERFKSLVEEGKFLSLSFWESEDSIEGWRTKFEHRHGQQAGRDGLFHSYHIRVAEVVRDYTMEDREQVPPDSNRELS